MFDCLECSLQMTDAKLSLVHYPCLAVATEAKLKLGNHLNISSHRNDVNK